MKIKVFLLFLLGDGRIRSQSRIRTCDCRIRMRIWEAQKHTDPPDPDPQPWCVHGLSRTPSAWSAVRHDPVAVWPPPCESKGEIKRSVKFLWPIIVNYKIGKSSCSYKPVLWIRIHMDPHWFCGSGSGSGSALGMRIRIQVHGRWPKLTDNLVSCFPNGVVPS